MSERPDDKAPRDAQTAVQVPGPRRTTKMMVAVPDPDVIGNDDRYADRGEIARGGQGAVRKVFDRRLERHAALKLLDINAEDDPDAKERFLYEARITGQLDHPNIVPIYDLVEEGSSRSFLMKLVEGETLSLRLRRPVRGDLDLARLLEVFLKICDAVAFAHSRGVIHRDLKPGNVMLGEFGQVYVMDWGCALVRPKTGVLGEAMPQPTFLDVPGTIIGTPAYMAPEQAAGKTEEIDDRTDVFGLGAILYEILTGVPPYNGADDTATMELARQGKPQPPSQIARNRTPPTPLVGIAMRALAFERAERFPTVLALRDEVERYLHRGVFFASRPFPAGTLIVQEGDRADEAYLIMSGRCEAFRHERGRRILLRTFGPGDVFGEAALFDGEPRNASVVALEDVTAVVVTREVLNRELGNDTWVGTFVRALIGRFRDLDARNALTRRVVENGRISALITHHLSRAGSWTRGGAVAMSWSRLWLAIESECGVSEDAALAIVARTADLHYDRETDMITLELLSMA